MSGNHNHPHGTSPDDRSWRRIELGLTFLGLTWSLYCVVAFALSSW